MARISIVEAERDFSNLVNRVYAEGISIDLEKDDKVIARLTPAIPEAPLKVRDLNAFLQSLPKLGEDANAFSRDVQAARGRFPAETNPWD